MKFTKEELARARERSVKITLHPATLALVFGIGWALGVRMGADTVHKNNVEVLRCK